jgi:hypothetical protein
MSKREKYEKMQRRKRGEANAHREQKKLEREETYLNLLRPRGAAYRSSKTLLARHCWNGLPTSVYTAGKHEWKREATRGRTESTPLGK